MPMKRILSNEPIQRDLALLLLRLGVGLSMLLFHGWGKMTGGVEAWERVGSNMSHLGISFAPAFWGFMAAFSESIGSLLIALGVLFRPAAALLAFTMVIAMLRHLDLPPEAAGSGWKGASHALELFAAYVALLLAGPGRYVPFGRPRP